MRIFLIILSLLFCSCETVTDTNTLSLTGKVVAIADGDTFTLLTDDHVQRKIRLHGIDCPEKRQDFGQVARQKLSNLVFGQQVRIEKRDIDRYKRIVAVVYDRRDRCINEEMLKAGLAWHYSRYDNNREWARLEESAREQGIGLWSQPDPTPPWQWRRK